MSDCQNDNDKGQESYFWFGSRYYVGFQNLSGKNGPVALLNICGNVKYMWFWQVRASGSVTASHLALPRL